MKQQELIAYFQSIAQTSSEELYIERMFEGETLSSEDTAFLSQLHEKQLTLLQKRNEDIDEALRYLSFDEKDIIRTFEEEEEVDADLKTALFQEAFTLRNTDETMRDTEEAEKIKKSLLHKK